MEAQAGKRVTIVDVARHAGVSRAAVSKVLCNAYGVSPQMQDKVRRSIAELGYRPHAAARGMRGKTYTIGVVLDTLRNPFFPDVLDGIQAVLQANGYQLLVGAAGHSAGAQADLADAMADRRMDGVVLVAPAVGKAEVARIAAETPTVVIGHHDLGPHFDTVAHDESAGAELVVDHLVRQGHRRIAHLTTSSAPGTTWVRRPEVLLAEGFVAAMTARGLDPSLQARSPWAKLAGHESALELLSADPRPTAVMLWTDAAAAGAFTAAEQLGLRIPEDLSLVGYNNTVVWGGPPVHLTSVDQAGPDMGASAARLLLERIGGRQRPQQVLTAPSLVVRRTTAPPPPA